MKATGIVRRIDDLGRVVIPKEIRRTLRIKEGTPLEIFTDREGEIILKKYSPVGELGSFAGQYAESLSKTAGCLSCIADLDQVIAASGNGRKQFLEQPVSRQFSEFMQNREAVASSALQDDFIKIIPEQPEIYREQALCPILSGGDIIGAVALLWKEGDEPDRESSRLLASCAASFLGGQMEQ